ncbi:hypothetical protein GSI_08131 [Ganoderma sinense ZZ0214-1]|uniref:Uncharacterized protein n=1 Tax=Ganoderma sinense ZZ0214-1 TaxID=1077348 RepID=A0A2G8S7E5_9APHY|nr:hypothetical protein GSI_08131 [Ganoderma sinense ZZ0214-1]
MSDTPVQPEQSVEGKIPQTPPPLSPQLSDTTLPTYNNVISPPSGVPSGAGIIDWPVPHVIVFFRKFKRAYGRAGIAQLGYTGFVKELYLGFLWKRKIQRTVKTLDADFADSTFAKTATLRGVFYAVHGKDDVGLVRLGHIGWAGMVQNLVSITVDFEDEPEK